MTLRENIIGLFLSAMLLNFLGLMSQVSAAEDDPLAGREPEVTCHGRAVLLFDRQKAPRNAIHYWGRVVQNKRLLFLGAAEEPLFLRDHVAAPRALLVVNGEAVS